jgi:hypothetical protein
MRTIPFIVLGLLWTATPSFAAPQQRDAARDGQPVGERWNDRWQGRQHWLYDDVEPGAATDGFAANAQADCRHVTMRVKRSDGTTGVRRVRRCE